MNKVDHFCGFYLILQISISIFYKSCMFSCKLNFLLVWLSVYFAMEGMLVCVDIYHQNLIKLNSDIFIALYTMCNCQKLNRCNDVHVIPMFKYDRLMKET